jgi:hypothetical protein
MKRATIIIVGTIIVGTVALFSTFSSISVCGVCGCTCQRTELQIPFTFVTYWRFERAFESPLSEQVNRLKLAPLHKHDWIFIHGSGNGIMCALGSGGEIHTSARSPEVAAFIADTHRYRDADEARRWLAIALREREASALNNWLFMGASPYTGFESAEDYENWRRRADPQWPEFLEMKR